MTVYRNCKISKHKLHMKYAAISPTTQSRTSLIAQLVKNLPAMLESLVQFLGWEDPLEKG